MDKAKSVPKINPITFSNIVHNKNFFTALIQLLLVFYASGIAPALPPPILNFLSSTISRIVIYSIVLILAAYQPVTAIFASICVVVTMQTIQKMNMEEKLMSIVKYKDQNKTRENCMCFCSDEELNEALEKHLEKKRKEIDNLNKNTIHNTTNNMNNDIIQENVHHYNNSQEYEHEISIDKNKDNNNYNLHNNISNQEYSQEYNHEYNQEELYRKINLNDGTNKKQVSFSDHIFEEQSFNNPSPMITSENGPKAFNSDGHKYMDLLEENIHLNKDKISNIPDRENIYHQQNQNNLISNHNDYYPNMENHVIGENYYKTTQENINDNIQINMHDNIQNKIQKNIQESIQDNTIINENRSMSGHIQNIHPNINFSDLDFNDKYFHDNHLENHDAKNHNENVKSNNSEIMNKLTDDITGYINNDNFAIF